MKSTTLCFSVLTLLIACAASFGAGYLVANSEQTRTPEIRVGDNDDDEQDNARDDEEPGLLELPDEKASPADEPRHGHPGLKHADASEPAPAATADAPDETGPGDVEAAPDKKAIRDLHDKLAKKELHDKFKELERLEGIETIFNGKRVDFNAIVSGRVVDSMGAPVAGAKVHADFSQAFDSESGGHSVSIVTSRGERKGAVIATTDSAGLWTAVIDRKVNEKASLRVALTADADAYAPSEKESVTLKNGDERGNVNLVLRGAGTVTGRVVNELGHGVPGVNVGLNERDNSREIRVDLGGQGRHSATTDAAGEFRIEGVPEGRYEFKLTGTGVRQLSGPTAIDVQAGREARAPADFKVAATSSIRVFMQDSEGQPVRGWATLNLKDDSGNTVKILRGRVADGVFEANDPPPGSYNIEVNTFGYEPQTVRATIQEGQPCDLGTLVLVPAADNSNQDRTETSPGR